MNRRRFFFFYYFQWNFIRFLYVNANLVLTRLWIWSIWCPFYPEVTLRLWSFSFLLLYPLFGSDFIDSLLPFVTTLLNWGMLVFWRKRNFKFWRKFRKFKNFGVLIQVHRFFNICYCGIFGLNGIFFFNIFSKTRLRVTELFFMFLLFITNIFIISNTWYTYLVRFLDLCCCFIDLIACFGIILIFWWWFIFLLRILSGLEFFFVDDLSEIWCLWLWLWRGYLA